MAHPLRVGTRGGGSRTGAAVVAAGATMVVWTLAAAAANVVGATDQDTRPSSVFGSGIALIDLNIRVIDRDRRFVSGLRKEDFVVRDEGRPQEVVAFGSERVPVSLGILLDASTSMSDTRMASARAVVTALIDRLGPDEEAFLADFAEQARILTPWTTDRAALVRALERVRGNAFTGLYDAVNETIRMARTGVHARKVLLVVSDGHDTSSERSARQAREAIRGSEVVVYALALQEAGGGRRINAGALRNLTDETSGRTEIVVGSQNLEGAIARLADELGQQYVLGYAPPAGPAAQWHEIKVEVPRRDVTIHTRRGYVSR